MRPQVKVRKFRKTTKYVHNRSEGTHPHRSEQKLRRVKEKK